MNISKHDQELLLQLEKSLWQEKTRFDRVFMENVLAEDFFEFGRSGKIYTRLECLEVESQEIHAKFPLENFMVHYVDDATALTTYISEIREKTLLRANRSSLWVKIKGIWKLRFHQGTPTQ